MKSRSSLFALAFFALSICSCSNKLTGDGCLTAQICTEIFAAVNVEFVDAEGRPGSVKDVTVIISVQTKR